MTIMTTRTTKTITTTIRRPPTKKPQGDQQHTPLGTPGDPQNITRPKVLYPKCWRIQDRLHCFPQVLSGFKRLRERGQTASPLNLTVGIQHFCQAPTRSKVFKANGPCTVGALLHLDSFSQLGPSRLRDVHLLMLYNAVLKTSLRSCSRPEKTHLPRVQSAQGRIARTLTFRRCAQAMDK